MPEIHINGRFPYHNFSLETDDFEASYDTSSSLMVTGRSHKSTIAISTTANTWDSENSFCGIDFFIVFLSFALVTIIASGIWLVRKRRIMKTRECQEPNVSIQMDPLYRPTSIQNCS